MDNLPTKALVPRPLVADAVNWLDVVPVKRARFRRWVPALSVSGDWNDLVALQGPGGALSLAVPRVDEPLRRVNVYRSAANRAGFAACRAVADVLENGTSRTTVLRADVG